MKWWRRRLPHLQRKHPRAKGILKTLFGVYPLSYPCLEPARYAPEPGSLTTGSGTRSGLLSRLPTAESNSKPLANAARRTLVAIVNAPMLEILHALWTQREVAIKRASERGRKAREDSGFV